MKSLVKHIALILLVAVSLGLSSCNKDKAPRQKPPKFEIVSIDKVSGSMSGDWQVTATLANNSIYNIRILSAQAFLKCDGRKIANVALAKEFSVARRSRVQVVIPLRATLSNSLGALAAIGKISKGDFSNITIDYSVTAGVMASKFTFEEKDITLAQLSKEFNLGLVK